MEGISLVARGRFSRPPLTLPFQNKTLRTISQTLKMRELDKIKRLRRTPFVDTGRILRCKLKMKTLFPMKRMLEKRQSVSPHECRFFLNDIVQGLKYLHARGLVHGHLNISHFQLNERMHVIINDSDKPQSCRRPHKYDLWKIGLIIFTMLGVPVDYIELKNLRLNVPSYFPRQVIVLLHKLLSISVANAASLLQCEFLKMAAIPRELSLKRLVEPGPEFNIKLLKGLGYNAWPWLKNMNGQARDDLHALNTQLEEVLTRMLTLPVLVRDTFNDFDAQPRYWVHEHTNLHRALISSTFCYRYFNGAHGAIFADGSQIVVHKNMYNMKYICENGTEKCINIDNMDNSLYIKMSLLIKFGYYKRPVLSQWRPVNDADMMDIPYVKAWYYKNVTVVFHLTNSVIQIKYKFISLIFSVSMKSVTFGVVPLSYIPTIKYSSMFTNGCSRVVLVILGKCAKLLKDMMVVVNEYDEAQKLQLTNE